MVLINNYKMVLNDFQELMAKTAYDGSVQLRPSDPVRIQDKIPSRRNPLRVKSPY